ncbi:MAG: nicotinate-nucleotide adenylyltransferase [Clostridia bacterium]|nr:nicotinate-nucleotide adenylyltransferase [Clostridia bacterium]
MKQIGIMGGSFDPPHIGHLLLAEWIQKELKLEEIRFIPTGRIYHKEPQKVSAKDRLEMVRLAVLGYPAFTVDATEVEREGITYTYETVEELKQREPENQLTFLVGADSLDYMERWKYPERIFSACRIAAVIRPGFSYEQMEEKIRQLKAQFDADILLVPTPEIPISSTDLRKKLNGGESVKEWIPKPVEEYIKKHGLYQQKP